MATYIGVDFSGSAEQWGHRRNKSNVWISVIVKDDADCCMVTDLFRVQRCMNTFRAEHPFEALGQFLRQTDFVAAGIDAPFSIPKEYVPKQGYGVPIRKVQQCAMIFRCIKLPACLGFVDPAVFAIWARA